jgi:DNA-binding CsgD family transcriptional regulator
MTRALVKKNYPAALPAVDPLITPPRLLNLFQRSKFGLAIFDRQLRFAGVNPAVAKMNGLPEAAHAGRKISDVLGNAALTLAPLLEGVLASGRPISGFEWSGKLPARAEIGHWVADYLPVFDARMKISHVAALVWEVRLWARKSKRPAGVKHQVDSIDLSAREAEIVRLLAQGKCNKEISSILHISIKTVESHRSRILFKLHLDSLVGLVHYAIRTHLVEL